MKKLTNKKAFTLTELIVVIVIIGILAAVLVPSLTGYITKAKVSSELQKAEPYKTAFTTFYIEEHVVNGKTADLTNFNAYLQTLSMDQLTDGSTVTDNGFTYTVLISNVSYTVEYVHSTGQLTVAKTA